MYRQTYFILSISLKFELCSGAMHKNILQRTISTGEEDKVFLAENGFIVEAPHGINICVVAMGMCSTVSACMFVIYWMC